MNEVADLFVVVVLYQRSFRASATCRALLEQQTPGGHNTVFLLYDNSATRDSDPLPSGWQTQWDPVNGGLATAYNYALAQAKAQDCQWLLLLDQDTTLPVYFLAELHYAMRKLSSDKNVVAIVPIIKAGDKHISPLAPKLGRETALTRGNTIVSEWIAAINSGSCFRIEFLDSLSGFCSDFWLDYLDHWLFRMVRERGKRTFVSNVILQHDLSVANMNRGMSVQRYENVLTAEMLFSNRHLPLAWRIMLVPRLAARGIKHLFVTADKRLGRSMLRAAATQAGWLFRPRAARRAMSTRRG